ncbi:MAG: DUF1800 domain-containing protein [Thiotrichaceae bacterium]|nr:DUF1800 domain-containing protein [Thiotrichaceae bacterium]
MSRLSLADASHLVSRTGLGAEWGSIQQLVGKPINHAVDSILYRRHSMPPPLLHMSKWDRLYAMRKSKNNKRMMMRTANREGKALQQWWSSHLLKTDSPLLERMTLFWHNFFPSTIDKTLATSLLYRQNQLLRKHALGNFRTLLHDVAKDPAMLVYLDGYENVKGSPNENFAREVLELFTVGRGQYKEPDIREAARAFTGWGINNAGGFVNKPKLHDHGKKRILGKVGNFNGDQALDVMLKHHTTPVRIVERFWYEFVSVNRPNRSLMKRWAASFVRSNYNITQLLKLVLTSKEFWSPQNRGALIKSPIDLAVGTLRTLPYSLPRNNLYHQLSLMGQPLFNHSTVKGWVSGKNWVSTQSFLLRDSLLRNLTRGNLRNKKSSMDAKLPQLSRDEMAEWLLNTQAVNPFPEKRGKQRLIRALVLDPSYQVY